VGGQSCPQSHVTVNATNLSQALSWCYSSLDASRTNKVSLMNSNSIKNNISDPRGEECRNDRSAKKDHRKSKKRREKDCKHKQISTNTESAMKKRRMQDVDDGYESWTTGNWCLLLPRDNVNAQTKPAVRPMAHCSHKLQLGERKSIRIVAKRSLLDSNENDFSKHKRPYTDLSGQTNATISSPVCSNKRVAVPTSPPQQAGTNTPATMIKEPHCHDILLGSGGHFTRNASHPQFGNRFYRRLIEKQYADYARCTDEQQKYNIKQSILDEIKNTHDPPGRFLKRNNDGTELWNEISPKEACHKIRADIHARKYRSAKMQHQQQSNHSNAKSPRNVQQYHSALSPNDNAINIPRKRGKVATTLMTRSTISEPTCSAADTKRRHLLYNEAVQRARDYMLANYGQKFAEQHEEEEMVMV
jgi:hypothetical protein